MDEDFGPALVITPGDCEFHGSCQRCGHSFGTIRPNQSLDQFAGPWERHVFLDRRCRREAPQG